jgi:hypothetical protein
VIVYQLELFALLDVVEPRYVVVGRHSSNPGLNEGDEICITDWNVWDKSYSFKAKVVGFKCEAYFPDRKLADKHGHEAAKNGLLLNRIFLEAEDREMILEIRDAIEKNKPEM